MTTLTARPTPRSAPPPHAELLRPPELVPYFKALIAQTEANWNEEVARYRGERTVFSDHRFT